MCRSKSACSPLPGIGEPLSSSHLSASNCTCAQYGRGAGTALRFAAGIERPNCCSISALSINSQAGTPSTICRSRHGLRNWHSLAGKSYRHDDGNGAAA